jgi:hypothetical protein
MSEPITIAFEVPETNIDEIQLISLIVSAAKYYEDKISHQGITRAIEYALCVIQEEHVIATTNNKEL